MYREYVVVKRLPNYAADDLFHSKNVSLAYQQGEAVIYTGMPPASLPTSGKEQKLPSAGPATVVCHTYTTSHAQSVYRVYSER